MNVEEGNVDTLNLPLMSLINAMINKRRYYYATGIPGGIGVMDCTHVAIVRPAVDEHIYVNRKQYHSINVQLVSITILPM